jgi:nitroreductase
VRAASGLGVPYRAMTSGFDLEQTDKLLTTTRAVRKRLDLDRPVPRDLIAECIQIATQAPTGGNVQQWRWLIVEDPDTKAGLADLYRRAYAPYIAEQRRLVAETGREKVSGIISSSDHLAEILDQVPVHVIPIGLGRLAPGTPSGQLCGWFGSLLPAVWSFMLAARSRGLGTAWTTLHLAYEAEAAALLGIPDTVTQLALIPLAYYTGDDFKAGTRKDGAAVTYWNRWGAKA